MVWPFFQSQTSRGCIRLWSWSGDISCHKDGSECPISFASRLLSAEWNYAQVEKEALSLVFGVKKFLYGHKFTLIINHKSLTTILGLKQGIPALAAAWLQCWALVLPAYTNDIEFCPAGAHGNAERLLRFPLKEITQDHQHQFQDHICAGSKQTNSQDYTFWGIRVVVSVKLRQWTPLWSPRHQSDEVCCLWVHVVARTGESHCEYSKELSGRENMLHPWHHASMGVAYKALATCTSGPFGSTFLVALKSGIPW